MSEGATSFVSRSTHFAAAAPFCLVTSPHISSFVHVALFFVVLFVVLISVLCVAALLCVDHRRRPAHHVAKYDVISREVASRSRDGDRERFRRRCLEPPAAFKRPTTRLYHAGNTCEYGYAPELAAGRPLKRDAGRHGERELTSTFHPNNSGVPRRQRSTHATVVSPRRGTCKRNVAAADAPHCGARLPSRRCVGVRKQLQCPLTARRLTLGGFWRIAYTEHAGKSSLTVQFVENHFVDSYYPTIENTFTKTLKYKGQEYTLEIIDTAGHVRPPPPKPQPLTRTSLLKPIPITTGLF